MSENYFSALNSINVNGHVEEKGKLSYLSWTWAWTEVKKLHPDANFKVFENADGWNYFTDGRTCWVKCSVTINGIEHTEMLPVMNNMNRSIELVKVTSFDINRSIKRCITKACALHGLGLYIYAGEDLPECEEEHSKPVTMEQELQAANDKFDELIGNMATKGILQCCDCGCEIKDYKSKDGKVTTAKEIADGSQKMFGRILCSKCSKKAVKE